MCPYHKDRPAEYTKNYMNNYIWETKLVCIECYESPLGIKSTPSVMRKTEEDNERNVLGVLVKGGEYDG